VKLSKKHDAIEALEGGLIVSCQASQGEPLAHPEHILALSLTVLMGGACALRLEGVENVEVVRKSTKVPIIGLTKIHGLNTVEMLQQVYITATFEDAAALAAAGADIIALDATGRPRKDGMPLDKTIDRIHFELNKPVWADCATKEDGIAAWKAGADIISTTLYGYTQETLTDDDSPGFELLRDLIETVKVPVILEGRIWHPDEVTSAFDLGAFAVVVGSAITRPHYITKRFVEAINDSGFDDDVTIRNTSTAGTSGDTELRSTSGDTEERGTSGDTELRSTPGDTVEPGAGSVSGAQA
jgi:Putative N-acetylmannosamine-6-phosphate epimerase